MRHNSRQYPITIDQQQIHIGAIEIFPYAQLQEEPNNPHGTHALLTTAPSICHLTHQQDQLNQPDQPAAALFYIQRGAHHLGHGNGRKYLWLDQDQQGHDNPTIWSIAPGKPGIPQRQNKLHLIITQDQRLNQPQNLTAIQQALAAHWRGE